MVGFPSPVPGDHQLVLRAVKFAVYWHGNQRRRYTNEPYVNHLLSVAYLVAGRTTDPHIIAAAVLHDILEDTPVSRHELKDNFGARILEMVEMLTDVPCTPGGLNRAARQFLDRERIAKAGPEVQLIKGCDMYDNLEDIKTYDPNFYKVFKKEKQLLLDVMLDLDPHVKLMLKEERDLDVDP